MEPAASPGNRKIISVVAIVVLLAAAGAVYYFNSRPAISAAPANQWFLDLGNDQLFVVPANAVPPVPAPSGQKTPEGGDAGVKVYVMGCGSCEAADQFRAYLESFTPEAREVLVAFQNRKPGDPPPPGIQGSPALAAQRARDQGRLVASPDLASGWVAADSAEGRVIRDAAAQKCGAGAPPIECFPEQ